MKLETVSAPPLKMKNPSATENINKSSMSMPNHYNSKVVVKYIGRYLGRPVIATSRVDTYDGDFVTFHYNQHEDDVFVLETIPVLEFIKRLIRYIAEKHYKIIHYGSIYARHREIDNKLHRAISQEKQCICNKSDKFLLILCPSNLGFFYKVKTHA